jgi:hypothetical protein
MARFCKITVVYGNYRRASLMAYTTPEPDKRNSVIERGVMEKLIMNMKAIVGRKKVLKVFVRHQIHSGGVAVERAIQQYNSLDDIYAFKLWRVNRVLYVVTDHNCPVKSIVKYVPSEIGL